jgi:hypothetical protein
LRLQLGPLLVGRGPVAPRDRFLDPAQPLLETALLDEIAAAAEQVRAVRRLGRVLIVHGGT